jgi:hypothetical protein
MLSTTADDNFAPTSSAMPLEMLKLLTDFLHCSIGIEIQDTGKTTSVSRKAVTAQSSTP